MKTCTLYKYFIFAFFTLLTFSCTLIDEENTPEMDIQETLIPSEVSFLYNLIEPEPEDPQTLTFLYEDDQLSSIYNLLTNEEIYVLEFSYGNDSSLNEIEVKKNDIVQKVYTFSSDASKITVLKDNVPYAEAILHSNQLVYSVENFEKKQISYFTYESGELSVKRTFDNSQDISNGTPKFITNFSYSPFGNALFSSVLPVNTLFLLDEIDEFLLTKFLTTSNTKVNLGLKEGSNNATIDYRTVFNEESYPSSISMIYREDEQAVRQIIHNVSYDIFTPF
ncbi:hypothetical protein [Flammeovirga sp. SJP92]|uniref:hypothetical protein n=1 Tax=Flammeovirga sp. SJP92 TaxID=1775430 RepID=UPI000787C689|nr:hypothetical protein [Flammeovirga sp. SJP92]KXX69514.1 hypothetical protein AVL50_15695 [Flammeovirga sp. SJP92]